MLTNIHVKNLALIEEENIDFEEGLNILSGETGAGKSIILGSVNAALGAKTSPDFIRTGCEYGLSEVSFYISDDNIISEIGEMGIENIEDGELLISRRILPNRSQIKVNGQSFTASQTRMLADLLIDIHGQHDNGLLMNEEKHLELLDIYAKDELSSLKDELKTAFKEYQDLKRALEEINVDDHTRQREISFLEFEINEIEAANISVGEDDTLETEYRRMNNYQKIATELSNASRIISEDNANISDMTGNALKSLIFASQYDETLSGICDTLSDVDNLLNDVRHSLNAYMDELSFDESEFIRLENRLNLINSLKMKYGNTIELILDKLDEKKQKLSEYNNFDVILEQRRNDMDKAFSRVKEISLNISEIRKSMAHRLELEIIENLKELNFMDVRFEADLEELDTFSSNGCNRLKFMISTNIGEDLKPLSRIASGGELSRIMLAVKSVMASKESGQTLIFDEIDAGISGRTAQMVANKLKRLSKAHQIICITHLPQIAAMADHHFIIEKSARDNRTVSSIRQLDEEGSIEELARMLGGSTITQAALSNAKELRKQSLNNA